MVYRMILLGLVELDASEKEAMLTVTISSASLSTPPRQVDAQKRLAALAGPLFSVPPWCGYYISTYPKASGPWGWLYVC